MTPALRDLVRSWACNSHDSHLEVLLGHPACTVHACMVDVDRRQRTAGGPEDDGLRKCLPYSNFPGNVNFEVKESRRFKDSQNVFLGDRWRVTCSNIFSAFAWENERLAFPQRLPNSIPGLWMTYEYDGPWSRQSWRCISNTTFAFLSTGLDLDRIGCAIRTLPLNCRETVNANGRMGWNCI